MDIKQFEEMGDMSDVKAAESFEDNGELLVGGARKYRRSSRSKQSVRKQRSRSRSRRSRSRSRK